MLAISNIFMAPEFVISFKPVYIEIDAILKLSFFSADYLHFCLFGQQWQCTLR